MRSEKQEPPGLPEEASAQLTGHELAPAPLGQGPRDLSANPPMIHFPTDFLSSLHPHKIPLFGGRLAPPPASLPARCHDPDPLPCGAPRADTSVQVVHGQLEKRSVKVGAVGREGFRGGPSGAGGLSPRKWAVSSGREGRGRSESRFATDPSGRG